MTRVLIYDERADYYATELAARLPGPEYLATHDPNEALALVPGAQVIVGLGPYIPSPVLRAAAEGALEWVQALTTGIDTLLADPRLRGVALTNCAGIHGPQMTELVLLSMMALARDYPGTLARQRAQIWDRREQPLLAGKTLCIVGLGAIAETLCHVARAFGMRVVGVSDGRSSAPGFAAVYPRAALHTALAEADFTVLLVPHSAATHHMIDADALAAMPPGAFLVNLSRGGCVDEAALYEALATGHLGGAALDVFETEPLPPGDRLWTAPRCIVTPHIGGFSDTYHTQALPVVAAHLAEYLAGGVDALTRRMDRG